MFIWHFLKRTKNSHKTVRSCFTVEYRAIKWSCRAISDHAMSNIWVHIEMSNFGIRAQFETRLRSFLKCWDLFLKLKISRQKLHVLLLLFRSYKWDNKEMPLVIFFGGATEKSLEVHLSVSLIASVKLARQLSKTQNGERLEFVLCDV